MDKNALPLFIANDLLDEDFVDYLGKENKEIHDLIRYKKYTVKGTDTSYRVINHWDNKGILPDGIQGDEEKWRKFSFIEIVWLEIVKELRSFGISLEDIKSIKEQVLIWNEKEKTYPWFEYFVIKSTYSSLDAYIAVTSSGKSGIGFSRDFEMSKSMLGSRSALMISLKEILSELGLDIKKPERLISVNQNEHKILDILRTQKVDSITLKMKKGKLFRIDTEESVFGSQIEKYRDEIKDGKIFADLLACYENGSGRSAKLVKKTKL